MILENRKIRPSSLTGYRDCARRTAARMFFSELRGLGYHLKNAATSVGALVGSGTHEGAASILTEKMKSGELGNLTEAKDRAQAEFDRCMQEEGCVFDQTTANRSTAQKQIDRMVTVYRGTVAKDITPVAVEERLGCNIGDGWIISGQTDQIVREESALHDLKTGTVKRRNGPQYGAYSMIFRAHGYDIKTLIEDFLPRVALKKPQPPIETVRIDVDEAEHEALDVIDRMKTDTAEFERRLTKGDRPPEGAFSPNPQSMLCSPKYCPAHGTKFCKAHA